MVDRMGGGVCMYGFIDWLYLSGISRGGIWVLGLEEWRYGWIFLLAYCCSIKSQKVSLANSSDRLP